MRGIHLILKICFVVPYTLQLGCISFFSESVGYVRQVKYEAKTDIKVCQAADPVKFCFGTFAKNTKTGFRHLVQPDRNKITQMSRGQAGQNQLTPYDEQYLEDVVRSIEEGGTLQAVVNKLTSTCWKTCFGKSPSFPLSNKDKECLVNCATKYTETSSFLIDVLAEEAAAEVRKSSK